MSLYLLKRTSIRDRELARLLLECLQNCNRRALQPAENTN